MRKLLLNTYSRFIPYIWCLSFIGKYKLLFILLILLGFIETAIELSLPLILSYFVDVVLPEKQFEMLIHSIIGVILLITILLFTVTYESKFHRLLPEWIARDIQRKTMDSLWRLGIKYSEEHTVGEVLSVINTDVAAAKKVFERYFPFIIWQLTASFVSIVIMINIHFTLTIAILCGFTLYYLVGPKIERLAFMGNKESYEVLWPQVQKKLYESVTAFTELKAHNRDTWDLQRLLKSIQGFNSSLVKTTLFNYLRGGIRRFTVNLGMFTLFLYGTYLVKTEVLTIGNLVTMIFYYAFGVTSMTHLITNITEQRLLMVQINRLFHFCNQGTANQTKKTKLKEINLHGKVVFKDVSYSNSSRDIIKNISFTVNSGEKVAIIGESGSGKTTLLKLLGGFYEPQHGNIEIDDISLNKICPATYWDHLGFVFQDTFLFGTSIRENIRFGWPEATENQIIGAAKLSNAHQFIQATPQGYDTVITERGNNLSGGERQRIGIARIFLRKAKILLLDEVTSSLDSNTEYEIMQSLDKLCENKTTFIVTHRLELIKNCDKIMVMHDGRLVEMGSYTELLHSSIYLNHIKVL